MLLFRMLSSVTLVIDEIAAEDKQCYILVGSASRLVQLAACAPGRPLVSGDDSDSIPKLNTDPIIDVSTSNDLYSMPIPTNNRLDARKPKLVKMRSPNGAGGIGPFDGFRLSIPTPEEKNIQCRLR